MKNIFVILIAVTTLFACDKDEAFKDKSIWIPTAFSPNSDGINDVFLPFVDEVDELMVYSISIFDEDGNELFSSNSILEGWDGKNKKGNTCSIGIYYYHFLFEFQDGTTEKYSGTVRIVC